MQTDSVIERAQPSDALALQAILDRQRAAARGPLELHTLKPLPTGRFWATLRDRDRVVEFACSAAQLASYRAFKMLSLSECGELLIVEQCERGRHRELTWWKTVTEAMDRGRAAA